MNCEVELEALNMKDFILAPFFFCGTPDSVQHPQLKDLLSSYLFPYSKVIHHSGHNYKEAVRLLFIICHEF